MIILVGGNIFIRYGIFPPSRQAKHVVEGLYEYEQTGDYSNSWELLHTSMKERFPKGGNIHRIESIYLWGILALMPLSLKSVIKENSSIGNDKRKQEQNSVNEIKVTQSYEGKYGTLDLFNTFM